MAPNDATAPSPITAAGTSSTQRETASPTSAATANRAHIQADGTAIRISEGAPAAVVVLRRSGGNMARPVTVTWQLQDGSAHSGEDFTAPATRSTRFAGGQTTRAIYVPLVNDDVPETEESFSLALQSSTATVDGSSSVQITILDDD